MVFTLDTDLPPALAPLAWLIGRWEGAGVVGYPTIESKQFGQEIVCSHDGRPFLEWHSHTWLLDEDGQKVRPLATELGFWRPLEAQPDGSNVEFLLALAIALDGLPNVWALAGDTDGVDGLAEIAGAVATPDTLARAWAQGIRPKDALAANDGHGFFGALGDAVLTGPTRTNVNDFRAVLIAG